MLPWSLVNINSRGVTITTLQGTHLQRSTKDQISTAEAKGFLPLATPTEGLYSWPQAFPVDLRFMIWFQGILT